jgi:UDP-sulfoquinovose synthase
VEQIFREFQPKVIVHFGECPSAPYSMIDVHYAVFVQTNNITTTFNLLFAMRTSDPRPA